MRLGIRCVFVSAFVWNQKVIGRGRIVVVWRGALICSSQIFSQHTHTHTHANLNRSGHFCLEHSAPHIETLRTQGAPPPGPPPCRGPVAALGLPCWRMGLPTAKGQISADLATAEIRPNLATAKFRGIRVGDWKV